MVGCNLRQCLRPRCWKVSKACADVADKTHVSQPYRTDETTTDSKMATRVFGDISYLNNCRFSPAKTPRAVESRAATAVSSLSSSVITLPRYLKELTTLSATPYTSRGRGSSGRCVFWWSVVPVSHNPPRLHGV